ncbi:hypothetical protein N431DRAFT_414166 [Stipitochalara longipes BDJ]|nr:hypothetical protein N431DRAFT_414166 [Stipitochalara longipes BDJ]
MASFLLQLQLNLILGVLCFVIFWLIRGILPRKAPILITDVTKCHELLSTTTLKKRAALNQRLVVAFGIENGFTTANEEIHSRFSSEIAATLERNNNDPARKSLGDLVSHSVQDFLQRSVEIHQSILLINLVRIAVFRTVLALFFPEVTRLSNEDIMFITAKMNSLWQDSKSPWKIFQAKYFPSQNCITRDKNQLHQRLTVVFPSLRDNNSIEPSQNPLNILLPACMGLFRVVLNCLLEVRFRSSRTNFLEYTHLFQQFLDEPNARWPVEENDISVQQIIAETLRLYPPTRRIYTKREEGVVAVDIEQVHRTGEVWGENPLEFDPKRWKREGLDTIRTVEYFPFGGKIGSPAKISRCPSRTRGGPKLIAVIVGSLLRVLGDEWHLLKDGEAQINRDFVPVPSFLSKPPPLR